MSTNGPAHDMPRFITDNLQLFSNPPPLPSHPQEPSRPVRIDLISEIKRQLGLREDASGQAVLNAIGEIQAKEAKSGRKVRLLAETLQQMVD